MAPETRYGPNRKLAILGMIEIRKIHENRYLIILPHLCLPAYSTLEPGYLKAGKLNRPPHLYSGQCRRYAIFCLVPLRAFFGYQDSLFPSGW